MLPPKPQNKVPRLVRSFSTKELAAGQCKVSWLSADLKTGDATSATTCKARNVGIPGCII